jgi:peptide/nickel transport system substrate-binding protein
MFVAAPAFAEKVLRLDEAPVGEIDPAKATDYADTVLMVNLYDTLVYPKKGAPGLDPLLAADWTTDGTTYTFKLKDGVKFHSGNPLTADDVVFSYNRLIALGQGFASLFVDRVAKVEAVDPLTVKFTLKEPYAPFLASLVRLQVVDAKTVMANKKDGKYGEFGDYAEEYLSAHDAGSGAYSVESQNPQSETVMVKFPGYFRGFADNAPDRVRYRYGMEASTVRAALSTGEHDIADLWLPPEVIKALAQEKGIRLYSEGGATGEFVKLNTARPPLDDVHCRLALTYAFDYGTALKLLKINDQFSQGIPANGPIPSGLIGHDDTPAYAQDLDKAKAELAQCKYKPGDYPLELSWIAEVPARERIALLMKANFEAIGFKANVTKVPWALLTEQVTKPETTPHAAEIAVSAVTPDPDSLLYNMYSSKVPPTWMSAEHLKDDKVDQLLDAGRSEADPAKRAEIYNQLNARLRELAPTLFIYELTGVYTERDAVTVPALADKADRYFDNFNLVFREMSIAD